MSNLFKKAAVLTDFHFGLKSNSLQHNQDCANFVDWFITKAKKENCETCFFLGDYNHHRASINIHTLQFGLQALEKLSANFDTVYFIPGNHDLYYRDRRDIHSVEWAKHLPNIKIVNDFFSQGDVVIAPWLVHDDYKKLQKLSGKYMFGHFELPYFHMNAMVEMPDHGEINEDQLGGFEKVFSGHFHKRQARKNIWYIGNAFPHNYADVDDNERGAMFLEWGGEPQYVNWTECPKYKVFNLRTLLDNHANLLDEYTYARVKLDISISYEEANFIREKFAEQYNVRELQLVPIKEEEEYEGGEITFESVNQIVLQQLDTIESNTIQKDVLINIYNSIDTD